MPDEQITDCEGVAAAVARERQTAHPDDNERRYIIRRAVELGCTDKIPDDWGIQ